MLRLHADNVHALRVTAGGVPMATYQPCWAGASRTLQAGGDAGQRSCLLGLLPFTCLG